MRETGLGEYFRLALPDAVWVPVKTVLCVRTPKDLLASQKTVLRKQVGGLLLGPRETSDGLWVSSRAKVSALAELSPPLYIGPNCLIGPGVHLGPHAAVGAGCIIDGPCRISNTTVLPDSFVGAGTSLDRAVVDRDLVVDSRNSSAVVCSDPLILGSVSKISLSSMVSRLSPRLFALALLVALLPLFAPTVLGLFLFRRGRVFCSPTVVRLPVLHAGSPWPSYRLYKFASTPKGDGLPRWLVAVVNLLPGLLNVLRGEICFVGLMPRTPEEINELPEDWRDLYLHSRGGLLSISDLLGADQTIEDEFAADAAYATGQPWRRDLRVLAAYLLRAVQAPLKLLLVPLAPRADKVADGITSRQHVCHPEDGREAGSGSGPLPQFVLGEETTGAVYPFSPRRGDNGYFNSRPPRIASSE
jgi:lipopolysaccharide/colanic/teichoic acid biosynthesis glycosyltransferase